MSQTDWDIVVVGGAGHVGLPLSIALADRGQRVLISDISREAVATVNSDHLPFREDGAGSVLQRVVAEGRLHATTEPAAAGRADVVIGTPVDELVYESTDRWPSVEGDERQVAPPLSSYGFQKLAVEYFARAAWDQYELPYTIVRPFNCVGIGESRALGDVEVASGNVKLAMSHVVPDLVQKIVKGQDPLHIFGDGSQVRHYTYGGDLARGILACLESEAAHAVAEGRI